MNIVSSIPLTTNIGSSNLLEEYPFCLREGRFPFQSHQQILASADENAILLYDLLLAYHSASIIYLCRHFFPCVPWTECDSGGQERESSPSVAASQTNSTGISGSRMTRIGPLIRSGSYGTAIHSHGFSRPSRKNTTNNSSTPSETASQVEDTQTSSSRMSFSGQTTFNVSPGATAHQNRWSRPSRRNTTNSSSTSSDTASQTEDTQTSSSPMSVASRVEDTQTSNRGIRLLSHVVFNIGGPRATAYQRKFTRPSRRTFSSSSTSSNEIGSTQASTSQTRSLINRSRSSSGTATEN